MQNNTKKISVSQYMKLPYKGQKKTYSRDTLIRRLRNGDIPEDIETAELVGVTYVLTLKQGKNER